MSAKFIDKLIKALRLSVLTLILITGTFAWLFIQSVNPGFSFFPKEKVVNQPIPVNDDPNRIENGIHVRTGLIEGEGLMTVVNNCTSCHSSKLVIQNRMSAERWNATIRWMQETQNLGDLGENQAVIVKYLTTYYPVKRKGRRENLTGIEWYELEE